MLTEAQRRFLERHRVARFASADGRAQPHVVPVCYGVGDATVYFTIDEKPKRAAGARLKRLRNIRENPRVALVVDRYEEDWSLLGWVMVQGRADVIEGGDEHAAAQRDLRVRYVQLASMRIEALPVVAIRIERVLAWGNLEPA